jgi:hypothetical protein
LPSVSLTRFTPTVLVFLFIAISRLAHDAASGVPTHSVRPCHAFHRKLGTEYDAGPKSYRSSDHQARTLFRDVSLIQRIPEGGVSSSIRAVSGEDEAGELRVGPAERATARRSRAERRSQAGW